MKWCAFSTFRFLFVCSLLFFFEKEKNKEMFSTVKGVGNCILSSQWFPCPGLLELYAGCDFLDVGRGEDAVDAVQVTAPPAVVLLLVYVYNVAWC